VGAGNDACLKRLGLIAIVVMVGVRVVDGAAGVQSCMAYGVDLAVVPRALSFSDRVLPSAYL
jgi:hypothetical protein